MTATRAVSVTVPATTANLGPGFDCLGLALELRNEFHLEGRGWVERPEEVALSVQVEGEGTRTLARDQDNLVYRAAREVFARHGRYPKELALSLRCRIPVGKGLGSSASAIVGGVWGAAALLGGATKSEDLLEIAVGLEGHPDNVVPAVLGGLTASTLGVAGEPLRAVELALDAPLIAVVAVPSFSVRTATARRRLPRRVPLEDAVFNLGRVAILVAGATRGDWATALRAMEDRLHQPYRKALIPGFDSVCQAAREAGAGAAVLSGAGPSVLALLSKSGAGESLSRELAAQKIGDAMVRAFLSSGVTARALTLEVAHSGVQVLIRD